MSKSLYVLFALIIGASSVFAHSNWGKKLEIQTNSTGTPKELGLRYSYDFAWGWQISFISTLKSEDIASLPERLTAQLINPSNNKVYHTFEEIPKTQLLFTQLTIHNQTELREILPVQKDLTLAFINPEDNSYIYNFSLNEICTQHSLAVKDLTRKDRKSCVVDPQDFFGREECAAYRLRLLESIKQGFITCTVAKEYYAKMGCGVLDCK